jgi:hypothetical protein
MNKARGHSNRLPALLAFALLAIVGGSAFAADPAPASAPAAKPFKEEELASLLAPIALYPDEIVAQILMAATYPLEIVEANRWVEKNKTLKGDALAAAAKKQPWDPSVQAMTGLPDVLKMMDEKLDWTQKLGDAMLAQQKEVMDMIQELRAKAKAEGNLKSDDHMKVTTEPPPAEAETKTEVIVIESANPEVIYVPTYNPVSVYGYWGYPAYPPYYWPPPIGYPGSGFWWGVGVGISIGVWGGAWNNNCNWHGGDIDINTGDINIDRGDRNTINTGDRGDRAGDRAGTNKSGSGKSWSHNPEHRKGASYRDSATAQKYNRPGNTSGGSRDAYRGRTGTGSTPSAGTRDLSSGGSRTGASAGTRDLGGSGASAGTSNLGSTGTRELGRGTGGSSSGSSTRGTSASTSSRGTSSSSSRGSSGSAFGGMSSGSRASSYGSRGGMSRGGGGGGRGGRR